VRRKTGARITGDADGIVLRLDYRPPYDWPQLLAFLRVRAIPGVETVDGDAYRRVAHCAPGAPEGVGGKVGVLEVRPLPGRNALALGLAADLVPVAMPLVARVRRMFDLDARPDAIAAVLGRDRTLAPLVAARPGLRLPGALDPFEAAVRALIGQQVSVAAATTIAGRFAAALGTRVGVGEGLAFRFPTAREVAAASPARIAALGMPEARARAIHELARAVATRVLRLDGPAELDAAVAALVAMRGIGPWTAHYLAMRALHLPDAFPAGDLGVQKALGSRGARGARDAEARAEAWRPFRAYAVMHLWNQLSEGAE
jgi:AraC family transcriptional regulator of adaptative response / DNA-3-methyladenine glycosylase II